MRVLLYAAPLLIPGPNEKEPSDELIEQVSNSIRDLLEITKDTIKDSEEYYTNELKYYTGDFDDKLDQIWDELYTTIENTVEEYNKDHEDLFFILESFDPVMYYSEYHDCYVLTSRGMEPQYEDQICSAVESFMCDLKENGIKLDSREIIMVASLVLLRKDAPIYTTLFFPRKNNGNNDNGINPFTGKKE